VFQDLARLEAAHHLLEAAHHLLEVILDHREEEQEEIPRVLLGFITESQDLV
jgi:hypothetical protein